MEKLVKKFSRISDKEKKIYCSVIQLIQNGRDINSLTVSEITENAGIGKGTAYGYFKSKDEMVENAVLYGIFQCISNISEQVAQKQTFEEKYIEILNWLERIFFEERLPVIVYQLTQGSVQTSRSLEDNMMCSDAGKKYIEEKVAQMVEVGVTEGTLRADYCREYQHYMVMSSIGAFWMFLNQEEEQQRKERDCFKAYLYRCLVMNLNQV